MMNATKPASRLRRIAVMFAAAGALLLGAAGGASALPPDGPGADSPGTSSRVWPTEVSAGDRLNFQVSGYPANETVYIKIDDGLACSDTSHGACVYATQKLDASGSATGSIIVPDSLAPGAHWLRMLATGDVFDSETGDKLGYEGYTRRGGNDFTVVAVAGSSSGRGQADGSSSSNASGQGQAGQGSDGPGDAATGSTTTTTTTTGTDGVVQGGSVDLNVDDAEATADDAATTDEADEQEQAAAVDAEVAETPEALVPPAVGDASVAAADVEGEVVPISAEPELPVVGIAVLAGAVVLGGGALAWAVLRRRKAAAAPADAQ